MTSISEKLLIPNPALKGGYLNDIWNSLYNPDIINSIEEDNVQVKAIIMLLETAINSVRSIGSEVKHAENEKGLLQRNLEAIRNEKELLKQRLAVPQPCRQCPVLHRRLTEQMKQTAECKRSIQSIFTILKPTMTDNYGNDSQRIIAETQSLIGRLVADDPVVVPETPFHTVAEFQNSDESDQQKFERSLKEHETSVENHTPKKENGKNMSAEKSPILKSAKRRKAATSKGSQEEPKAALSLRNVTTYSKGSQEEGNAAFLSRNVADNLKRSQEEPEVVFISKNVALSSKENQEEPKVAFPSRKEEQANKEHQHSAQGPAERSTLYEWKLRADDSSNNNKQAKLKQATLAVKSRSRLNLKRDLSMMDGFNGGTLPRNSSSAADNQNALPSEEDSDDYIAKSPEVDTKTNSNLVGGLVKNRLRSSLLENSSEVKVPVVTLDETLFAPLAASTCNLIEEEVRKKPSKITNKANVPAAHSNDLSNKIPKKEKATTSSNFIYQRDAVKKKSERQKLEGWSCEDCRKYYEAMENAGMNVSQIKRNMNKCSRHRSKFPKTNTPPGFWNPKFDTSDEDD